MALKRKLMKRDKEEQFTVIEEIVSQKHYYFQYISSKIQCISPKETVIQVLKTQINYKPLIVCPFYTPLSPTESS